MTPFRPSSINVQKSWIALLASLLCNMHPHMVLGKQADSKLVQIPNMIPHTIT